MLLLVGKSHPTLVRYADPNLGRLVQPRDCARVDETAAAGYPWAADNDAFGGWDRDHARRYVRMLDAIAGVGGCRFVTLPDVVADARATAARFSEWYGAVAGRRLPVALVAQDGIEDLGVPWEKVDALFIGGSTEFKLGQVAVDLAAEANARGKWLHMGRVNSGRRIVYAKAIGCDSVDGSKFSRWTDAWIAGGLAACRQGRQLRLASG